MAAAAAGGVSGDFCDGGGGGQRDREGRRQKRGLTGRRRIFLPVCY